MGSFEYEIERETTIITKKKALKPSAKSGMPFVTENLTVTNFYDSIRYGARLSMVNGYSLPISIVQNESSLLKLTVWCIIINVTMIR